MQKNWRIGSLFGIPLYIHPSWFVILAFATLINAGDINASGLSGGEPLWGWITGLIMAILLFVSVLLHELGHSLVAQSQGISVNSITLFLFGGIASIDRESKTPTSAFKVAIAGPLVSIILCGLFFALDQFLGEFPLLDYLTLDLARINLVIALFNLIPGLPLDGGQILKAIVWKMTGDRFTGVHWAAISGKGLGLFAISVGCLLFFLAGDLSSLWIALIGWFVFRNANAYDRLTNLQEVLLQLSAADIMTREFRVINANLSVNDFAREYILSDTTNPLPLFAASEGRYRGLVRIADLQLIERSEWDSKTLAAIAIPLTEIPHVEEKTSIAEVIDQLEKIGEKRITVLSPAGAVAGVIDRGDIVSAIAIKGNLDIPQEDIEKIKAEGKYPPQLPLAKISATLDRD